MEYFCVEEFVPPEVYKERGNKAITVIDTNILRFIENLREALNKPITANNWKWGGSYSYRGYRTSASKHFRKYSQHSFGRALDFDVKGMSAQEVREWIIKNRELDWVKPITFLENSVSWVHIDTRTSEDNSLILWDVNTKQSQIYKRS